jgi:hypothetical protein
MPKRIYIFFITTIISFNPIILNAQWSDDPYTNTRLTYFGITPHPVSDDIGGALIAYRTDTFGLPDIYITRINSDGYLVWNPDSILPGYPVVVAPEWQQSYPEWIISDGNGGCYIAWLDWRRSETMGPYIIDVYVQRIDSTGTALWDQNGNMLTSPLSRNSNTHNVLRDSQNNCIVIWSEVGRFDDPFTGGLLAQKINPEGQFIWDGEGIVIDTNNNRESDAAINDLGELFTLYEKKELHYSLYLQKLDQNGNLLWPMGGKRVSSFGQSQEWPRINKCVDGTLLLSFTARFFSDSIGYYKAYLMLQKVNDEGIKLWGEYGISIDSTTNVTTSLIPKIKPINDCLFVVWGNKISYEGNDSDSSYTYYNFYDLNGQPVFDNPKSLISTNTPNAKRDVHIISDYIYVIFSNNSHYYLQKINQNGEILWDDGLPITLRSGVHPTNSIYDGRDGILFFWYEDHPTLGMYTQRIDTSGMLGPVTTISKNNEFIIPHSFKFYKNYPNPFNETTIFPFYFPHHDKLTITIYDNLSRVILEEKKYFNKGYHEFSWDTSQKSHSELSTGIYYVRFTTSSHIKTFKVILLK